MSSTIVTENPRPIGPVGGALPPKGKLARGSKSCIERDDEVGSPKVGATFPKALLPLGETLQEGLLVLKREGIHIGPPFGLEDRPFVRIPVKVAPRVGDVEDGADHEENDDSFCGG